MHERFDERGGFVIYLAYQATEDLMLPVRSFATAALDSTRALISRTENPAVAACLRQSASWYEMVSRMHLSHTSPAFGIDSVCVNGREVAVTEEETLKTPFGSLLHFRKDFAGEQPPVLLIAPLSGHFPTLLRETVRTMLPEHDVYITDWINARDIPVEAGRFGFEEFVDHLIQFLETLGPGVHLMAVCQPCPAAIVAASVMAKNGSPARPKSLTLMAGPVDARFNPTTVDDLATTHSIEWFEQQMIDDVPLRYKGAGRRVYPGFVQVSAFVSMNPTRHMRQHQELREDLAAGNDSRASETKKFYDEYFAVLDLPSEFYLETVEWIFQDFRLPKGELTHHGELVEPRALHDLPLLTIEGERDDICGIGQTQAAHELCSGISPSQKRHYLQRNVGHFGVFSGSRWNQYVFPIVRDHIRNAN